MTHPPDLPAWTAATARHDFHTILTNELRGATVARFRSAGLDRRLTAITFADGRSLILGHLYDEWAKVEFELGGILFNLDSIEANLSALRSHADPESDSLILELEDVRGARQKVELTAPNWQSETLVLGQPIHVRSIRRAPETSGAAIA